MFSYNELNERQMQAVKETQNHVRIIAGAGSGKTRVVISRIAYLIDEMGILPYRILGITFTNKAANEMKERLLNSLGDSASGVFLSTIHSFCVRFLREEIYLVQYPRNFTIVDTDDQKSILKEAYKMHGIDVKSYSYASVLDYIANCKAVEVDPEQAKGMANAYTSEYIKAQVYEYYESRLQAMYALDFDDLLLFTRKILRMYPEVRYKWQQKFDYIHVDEFQDVDKIQYDIIKYIVSDHTCLCVVGDPDQTIYTWRGADVNLIMNFDKDFAPCTTIILNENYRSTPSILNGANSVIKNNKIRIEKDLYTNLPDVHKIVHYSASEDDLEPRWVADRLEKLHMEGNSYRSMAVLYRSNYLSRNLEKKLLENKIPYRIYGGIRFYDRAEIKDSLSYLRMLIHNNSAIDLAFKRIINVPKRGIGNKSLEKIESLAFENRINMYEVVKAYDICKGKAKVELDKFISMIEKYRNLINQMSISMLLEALVEESGYLAMLKEEKENERIENIKELINDIEDFEENYPDGTLDDYLQQIALYTDKQQEADGDFVQLMTIHAAKGLEFDNVFVYSMCEGIFPNEKAVSEGGRSAMEEERRLAYVAFTRAKKQLYISDARGYSYVLEGAKRPSRFIREIDEDCIEHYGNQPEIQAIPRQRLIEESENKVQTSSVTRLRKGEIVEHKSFGEGVVLDTSNGIWTIAFKNKFGIRKIMANHPSISKK